MNHGPISLKPNKTISCQQLFIWKAYPCLLKKNGHPDTKLDTGTSFNHPAANLEPFSPHLSKTAQHRKKKGGKIITSLFLLSLLLHHSLISSSLTLDRCSGLSPPTPQIYQVPTYQELVFLVFPWNTDEFSVITLQKLIKFHVLLTKWNENTISVLQAVFNHLYQQLPGITFKKIPKDSTLY